MSRKLFSVQHAQPVVYNSCSFEIMSWKVLKKRPLFGQCSDYRGVMVWSAFPHFDANAAYLHGLLDEDIFDEKDQKDQTQLVCRFQRSIYGLQQSTRTEYLPIRRRRNCEAYLLVCVDDLLLALKNEIAKVFEGCSKAGI